MRFGHVRDDLPDCSGLASPVQGRGKNGRQHLSRVELFSNGLPLATMADLHRAGRHDRTSDHVLMLEGQEPLSVQEFVRKNAASFTASAKQAAK